MRPLPRSRTARLLLGLLLLSAAPMVLAQNARVAANPGADAPERANEATTLSEDEARNETGPAQRRARASTTGARTGEEGSTTRVPRWHSYLPGMFR